MKDVYRRFLQMPAVWDLRERDIDWESVTWVSFLISGHGQARHLPFALPDVYRPARAAGHDDGRGRPAGWHGQPGRGPGQPRCQKVQDQPGRHTLAQNTRRSRKIQEVIFLFLSTSLLNWMSGLTKEFFGMADGSSHILSRIFLDITHIPLWPDADSKLSWLEGPDNFRNKPKFSDFFASKS